MKKIIISIVLFLSGIVLYAQNDIKGILQTIEENNVTLKALRETNKAEKLNNRTGIYLSNPEVGLGYQWGSPSPLENKTIISVTQSFDIPTILGLKGRISKRENELLDYQYKAERINILLEAKLYCIDLIYYNALLLEMEKRLEHAQTIFDVYEARLKAGDANRLEYNKSKLNLATVRGEISRLEIERTTILDQLKRMNGGNPIKLEKALYEKESPAENFDDWFEDASAKNPLLTYARQEIELSKRKISLTRASGLPSFSAGYASEKVGEDQHQGIVVGISIPLWENKNRIKHAKAAMKAAEARETEKRMEFYNRLKGLYNQAKGFKNRAEEYHKILSTSSNIDLLKKALDAGEISLLEYILEIGLYYDVVSQALEAEKNYQRAFAELSAFDL